MGDLFASIYHVLGENGIEFHLIVEILILVCHTIIQQVTVGTRQNTAACKLEVW